LITYVVFISWIFYAMSCAGVIILRRKQPEMKRPYKTWGYPWVPLTFIVFAALLVLNTIIQDPRDSFIGLVLLLTGVPAYAYWSRKN
jgi:APA family basic amino acid/polyamine antiporter